MLEAISKNWWHLLIRGLLVLIFGLIALLNPGIVLASLLLYLGVIAIIGGIVAIIASFRMETDKMAGIIEGIIMIIIGLLFLFAPGFVLTSIVFFIGIWALISGIMQIVYAIKLRKIISGEWIAILGGIISIIFAFVLFFNVVGSAAALVMVIGAFALISGILQIILSFKIKGLKSA